MDFNEDLNATLPTVIKRTKKKKKNIVAFIFSGFCVRSRSRKPMPDVKEKCNT